MGRNHHALRQALRTVEDAHPNVIRQHLAETFIQLAGVDSAILVSLAQTAEGATRSGLVVVDQTSTDDRADRLREAANGTSLSDAFFDPTAPKDAETRRFHTYEELVGPGWSEGATFQTYHGRFGYTDAARVLVYDDLRFSQYVCVQDVGADGLCADALREANHLLPSLAAGVVFAVRKDAQLLDQRPTLVFGADGRVIDASRSAAQWLDDGRRSMLGTLVRRFDRTTDEDSEGTMDLARYRIVRLVDSGSRYVVMLDRAGVPTRSAHPLLTPREQQVAELLAAGATVREVASCLDVATGTAKSHARSLYRKLHVSNRVELVHALANP